MNTTAPRPDNGGAELEEAHVQAGSSQPNWLPFLRLRYKTMASHEKFPLKEWTPGSIGCDIGCEMENIQTILHTHN
jgi:hypothetical protein